MFTKVGYGTLGTRTDATWQPPVAASTSILMKPTKELTSQTTIALQCAAAQVHTTPHHTLPTNLPQPHHTFATPSAACSNVTKHYCTGSVPNAEKFYSHVKAIRRAHLLDGA